MVLKCTYYEYAHITWIDWCGDRAYKRQGEKTLYIKKGTRKKVAFMNVATIYCYQTEAPHSAQNLHWKLGHQTNGTLLANLVTMA